MFADLLPLFALIAVGAIAGACRLFPAPDAAIVALNRFALYLGFPALIVKGLGNPALEFPDSPGFYAAHVAVIGGAIVVLRVVGALWRRLRPDLGAVAMATMFGNTAYLGIPVCTRSFGENVLGIASVSAAIHVFLFMSIGPILLLRWSRHEGQSAALPWRHTFLAVAKQPLVWSPLIGLGVRQLPAEVGRITLDSISPLAAAASPAALVLLGLYVFHHRARMATFSLPTAMILAAKLALMPAIALAMVLASPAAFDLAPNETRVVILQAAMPVGLTTFAVAQEYGIGVATVAQAIIVSTLLSPILLPILAAWLVVM